MNLAYLIPLFPLIGFLLNGLLRDYMPRTLTTLIGSGTILASFVVSLQLFIQAASGDPAEVVPLYTFLRAADFSIAFSLQADQLTSVFLLIITGIGFLIHVYSSAYMHEENNRHYARYFAYLNLFVFSMLLLVMGSNFVVMFVGWEGVGLCSYLLIGYWFKNPEYGDAARKAFIMNRIGDLGFLLAILWILMRTGTTEYSVVFNSLERFTPADITAICMLLFVGAMGKSAQLPLYTWLPDAMAGPTPVSALIHAATMVTAGIYMIARCNVLYSLSPDIQTVIAITGLSTAFFAATIALKQNDIKKVLAYSTVSQLGYMFLGLGVGAYTGSVFHVMTHAFFKALLFLGAGSVIHAMHHEQDIRRMGGLRKKLPVTHITFLIGCIAISGIPPFSGFFSKDEILAAAYARNPVYWVVGIITAGMTAFYMFRLYATTFLGNFRGTPAQETHLHESPPAMTLPLVILALLSMIGGFMGIPEVLGGSHALHHLLSPVLRSESIPVLEHSTEYILMGVSVVLAAVAIAIAIRRFAHTPELEEPRGLGALLANKWYVDETYNALIVQPVMATGNFFKNGTERGIDGLVNGSGRLVHYSSRQLRHLQNGQAGSYLLFMVLGMVIIFLLWWNQPLFAKYITKIL